MTTQESAGLPRERLCAIVLFAAVVPLVLMAAPAIATQLAHQLGLGAATIGQLFSIELAAMSLATLPAYLWQARLDWRWVARVAALLFIAVNLASAFITDKAYLPLLMGLRFTSALAGGTLMVLCIASAVASDQRNRVYGFWLIGQLVLGAVGLWALPVLFAHVGLAALYLGLAGMMLLCLPLTRAFPAGMRAPEARVQAAASPSRLRAWCGLFAVLAFYIGLSGVWTFIGALAERAGVDPDTTRTLLAVASLLGIAGSTTVTLIGGRWPRGLPLVLGYAAMAASVLLLLGLPGTLRFAVAALLFKYTWTFVLPLILACLADLDRSGRLMNSVNLVIGGGLALGPAVAGPLLESPLGYSGMLAVSAGCLLLSFLALHLARRPTGAALTPLDPTGATS